VVTRFRKTKHAKSRTKRQGRPCPSDGSQNQNPAAFIRDSPAIETAEDADNHQQQPIERCNDIEPVPQPKNLLLQLRHIHLEYAHSNNSWWALLKPAAGGGTRYTSSEGDVDIASFENELAKTMVIDLLRKL
jgi:hypothetical protein